MQNEFRIALTGYSNETENLNDDGSINWNFVEADLLMDDWDLKIGGETFVEWFDLAADEIEMAQ